MQVTNDNKREYVNLVARHRMTTAIRPQIDAFLKGFWEIVPRKLIRWVVAGRRVPVGVLGELAVRLGSRFCGG